MGPKRRVAKVAQPQMENTQLVEEGSSGQAGSGKGENLHADPDRQKTGGSLDTNDEGDNDDDDHGDDDNAEGEGNDDGQLSEVEDLSDEQVQAIADEFIDRKTLSYLVQIVNLMQKKQPEDYSHAWIDAQNLDSVTKLADHKEMPKYNGTNDKMAYKILKEFKQSLRTLYPQQNTIKEFLTVPQFRVCVSIHFEKEGLKFIEDKLLELESNKVHVPEFLEMNFEDIARFTPPKHVLDACNKAVKSTNAELKSYQKVNQANNNNNNKKRSSSTPNDSKSANKKSKTACYTCGKEGHQKAKCPFKKRLESRTKDVKLIVNNAAMNLSMDDSNVQGEFIEVKLGNLPPHPALLDSGSMANFIRPELVSQDLVQSCDPIAVTALDGTFLRTVTEYVELDWLPLFKNLRFYVTKLCNIPVVLGKEVSDEFRKFPPSVRKLDFDEFQHLNSSSVYTQDDEVVLANIRLLDLSEQLRDSVTGEVVETEPEELILERDSYEQQDVKDFLANIFDRYSAIFNDYPVIHNENNQFTHTIELASFEKFPNRAPYPMSADKLKEIDSQVDDFIERGLVEKSPGSKFASPVILVDKPDGSKRLCVDYREVNKITKVDKFPLPLIEDLIGEINDAEYFSKLDLSSGYHQVNMAKEDRHITAFRTHKGLYQWCVMPFGLMNAPATFQRAMNEIFEKYLGKFVTVYLDDILIYSKTKGDHKEHIKIVFDLLEKHGLVAKRKKCQFFKRKIQYLGHIISKGRVRISPSKIDAVREWQFPKTKREMKSALGLASFCRKAIKGYSILVKPLMDWAVRNIRVSKTILVESFEKLKKTLTTAPVLVTPSPDAIYKVTTDASDYCTGAVIEKTNNLGKSIGVVAYFSKVMNKHERNYPPREKEFLAIIRVLERHKNMLIGHKVILNTDHESLKYILSRPKPLSGKMARWLDLLAEFDLRINYIQGSKNQADALTRRYQDFIQIRALHFTMLGENLGETFFDECRQDYKTVERSKLIYEILAEKKVIPNIYKQKFAKFSYKDGLLYHHGYDKLGLGIDRLWVPSAQLQLRVINQYHSKEPNLHPGLVQTFMEIQQYFWWPNMYESVRRFIQHCHVCQTTKPSTQKQYGLLQSIPIPTKRWQSITMDFISGFPTVDGKNQVLIVVDRFTKRAHFIPCSKNITASECAELIVNEVIKHHGVPEEIISDRDKLFTSRFWKDLFASLQSKLKYSTPYHPQTDGQTERTNRTFIQLLRAFSDFRENLWLAKLPLLEFAYNSHYHKSIRMSPFEADYGYQPTPPSFDSRLYELILPSEKTISALPPENKAYYMQYLINRISDNLEQAQNEQEQNFNKHRRELLLEPGDKVLLHRNAKVFGYNFKFTKQQNLYFGPYTVIKKAPIVNNAYELDLGPRNVGRMQNVKNMKPYHESLTGDKRHPPTDLQGLVQAARSDNIVGIKGLDILNRLVAITFKDCEPFHAGIYSLADVRQALVPEQFETFLQEYTNQIQTGTEEYDAIQELVTTN
ncbi:uncharacterized protein J8A68_001597 [[Candida] subhashii]|uniref:Uncharacterized protein n=1 Tax=[Candida] subhashii TaxID=561895 RepID=A0A8J5QQK1_9ASCO|nr:uncharacterized protein J8A68_001597 [[Candida] subhashii]KAG7664871.1 hypothetical protein J8A68_001597 [[Candida] subhashii]